MYTSEIINQTIKSAAKTADLFTHPLFILNSQGKPELLASAITINLDSKFYVISAGHVFKEISNSSKVPYLGVKSEFLPLTGKYIVSEANKAEKDHFDIGFIELAVELVNQKQIPILNFDMLMPYEFFDSIYLVMIYGYPNSKNKQSKSWKVNTFNTKSLVYSGVVYEDFPHWEKLKKSRNVHTCMSFGKNSTGNTPVHPRGLSGGGLWVIPNKEKPTEIFLDSIFIEYHRSYQVTFSTKIADVLAFIRKNIKQLATCQSSTLE